MTNPVETGGGTTRVPSGGSAEQIAELADALFDADDAGELAYTDRDGSWRVSREGIANTVIGLGYVRQDPAERKRRIIEGVREALSARFDDGGSVVEYIFATNPELKQQLHQALFGKESGRG